jgi:hypothetical protein
MEQDLTISAKKVVTYFEDYIRKDDIQKKIFDLREEVGIPKNGIRFIKKDREFLLNNKDHFQVYIPDRLYKFLGSSDEEIKENRDKLIILNISPIFSANRYSEFMDSMYRLYMIFNQTIPYFPKNLKIDDFLRLGNLKEDINLDKYRK